MTWLAESALVRAEDDEARPLFADEATLTVILSAPWRAFLRDGDSDERYPAVLEYVDEHGALQRVELTVERRGVTRRGLCRYPPLRLRFDRSTTAGTVFEGQRALKLVTHCSSSRRWEQYYITEMLAYRIYNRLTERSFRVRGLSITYHDNLVGSRDADRFGFVIEHMRDVARRNDMPRVRADRIRPGDYDAEEISRFMLFQYLIGNTDWSAWTASADERCCHNMRAMGVVSPGHLVAVPYDFDASGLVNASYAAPHESLPIREVTERLYRGFCMHNDHLEPVRRQFLALEEDILAVIRDEALLGSRSRNQALRYLQGSFQTLKNPEHFSRQVIARCRR